MGASTLGFDVAVPIAAQHDLFQVIGTAGGDGEPDVRDHAGAGCIEDFARCAGRHRPGVVVAAGAVEAGLLQRPVILSARVGGQQSGVFPSWGAVLCRRGGRRSSKPAGGQHAVEESAPPVTM